MRTPAPRPHKFPHNPLATRLLNGPRFPEEAPAAKNRESLARFSHVTADGFRIEFSIEPDAAEPIIAQGQFLRYLAGLVFALYPGINHPSELTFSMVREMQNAFTAARTTGVAQLVEVVWGMLDLEAPAAAKKVAAKKERAA